MNRSITNAPEDVMKRLRGGAAREKRSLQGASLQISVAALVEPRGADAYAVLDAVRRSGLSSPSESVQMIRDDRDGR